MSRSIRLLGFLLLLASGVPGTAESQRTEELTFRFSDHARGWLGLAFRDVEGQEWMAVTRVSRGSPAEAAGLARGDTITRWNGRTDPARAAMETPPQPGDTVRLRVRRGSDRQRDVVVVAAPPRGVEVHALGRAPRGWVIDGPDRSFRLYVDSLEMHADSLHTRLRVMIRDSLGPAMRRFEMVEVPRLMAEVEAVRSGAARGFAIGARSVAGAEFTELNEGLASYFGTERGTLALRVAPDTPAAKSGLQAGDVVVSANGRTITDVRGLRDAVLASRDRTVELVIVRRGARQQLRLRWE